MNRSYLIIVLLAFSFAFTSCLSSCKKETPIAESEEPEEVVNDTSPEFSIRFDDYTGWTYNQNIYEVNLRQFTPEGTFAAFESHLPRLQQMGVGVLWLMPIQPIGEENRKGSLGSYYAVKDYEDVNTEFGSMNQFKHLVEAVHKEGMYVVIDWVANHTAWDNKLTKTNPDFYLKTEDGNFQPPLGQDWADVIQLDYSNPELQVYMINTLKDWVIKTGIDGIRFDYVDGVDASFWGKVTSELKALKPDIFLIAEGDGMKYHSMGFDMDYCWGLHGWDVGTMCQIYEGTKTPFDLNGFVNAEKNLHMPDNYHMYFTSNHDENSWHGTEYEQLGDAAEVFAVLTQTLYGMPLVYSGQEAAMKKRLNFFEKDDIDWSNLSLVDFYTRFNELRKTNTALWNGSAGAVPKRISTTENSKVYAFTRVKGEDQIVVLLNLSDGPIDFKLKADDADGKFNDLFTSVKVNVSEEVTFSLAAWDYKVLIK